MDLVLDVLRLADLEIDVHQDAHVQQGTFVGIVGLLMSLYHLLQVRVLFAHDVHSARQGHQFFFAHCDTVEWHVSRPALVI